MRRTNMFERIVPWCLVQLNEFYNTLLYNIILLWSVHDVYCNITLFVILCVDNHAVYVIVYCKLCPSSVGDYE